jgi:O-antigen/teichoic acid export membrane protein
MIAAHRGLPASRWTLGQIFLINIALALAASLSATPLVQGWIRADVPREVLFAVLAGEVAMGALAQHLYRQSVAREVKMEGALWLSLPVVAKAAWLSDVWAIKLSGNQLSLDGAVVIYLLLQMATCVSLVTFLLAKFPSNATVGRVRRAMSQGASFSIAQTLRSGANELPTLMLAAAANHNAVAVYAIANRLFQFGRVPVQSVLGSETSNMFKRDFVESRLSLLRKKVLLLGLASTLLVAAAVLLVRPVLGPGYGNLLVVGFVFAIAVLPSSWVNLHLDVLTVRGSQKTRIYSNAAELVIVAVLCSISVYLFDGSGIELAILFSQLAFAVAIPTLVKRLN